MSEPALPPAAASAPPPGSRGARRIVVAAQVVVGAIVLGFAARALARYWRDFERQPLRVELQWEWVLASGMLFLATYAVLTESWRRALAAWDASLPFLDAARIWTVSSLGRYIPGKLWQVGAMGVMAQRRGISPLAATGSAILGTVVQVVVGLMIAFALGGQLAERAMPGATGISIILLAAGVAGLALLPIVLPRLVRLAERVSGRSIGAGRLPGRAIAATVVGNAVAWVLYGVAFQWLARGVLGRASGDTGAWIAVYALSYLFGYIMLFAPAGVGFREIAMVAVMPAAGLSTAGEAAVLAAASRIWLTVLEIVPGLLFLLRDTLRRNQTRNGPT